MKISNLCDSFIRFGFYALFFLVPLIWLPVNYELFEFNKMILVYLLTTIIVTAWVVKSIEEKRFVVKRTLLDIPILLFLSANFLATVFSIDPHTSIFGYYGRFHGGLLSTLAYTLLYFALVSNSTARQVVNYLWALLASSLVVSAYGVLQHPNPIFQTQVDGKTVFHGIDWDYWAVGVEERVFSTLGQPNWLAAFLAMTLFPLVTFLFICRNLWQRTLLLIGVALTYLAFTFAYSRGATLGLLVGILTFVALLPTYKKSIPRLLLGRLRELLRSMASRLSFAFPQVRSKNIFTVTSKPIFWVLGLLAVFLVVNFYFGNAIERRTSVPTITPQNKPTQEQVIKQTALEYQGKDTAKVRTIVWTGALQIFKHYPILGTGVETFGFSYYLYRPVEHNKVAEWDYLYNKAHNEYLNYSSTTGAVGLVTYFLLIGVFEFLAIRFLLKSELSAVKLLSLGLLASYNSYLVQNFFGFSVVPIALLFFLYPAIFIVLTNRLDKTWVLDFSRKLAFLNTRPYNPSAKILASFVGLLTLVLILSMWLADFYYNQSLSGTSYEKSIRDLKVATKLNPFEPIYEAELALNLSGLASTSDSPQETKKAKNEARKIINQVVKQHPNNLALWQSKRAVDFTLAKIDKGAELELLGTSEKLRQLAPTDASIQYDVALVYSYVGKSEEAEKQLEKVVELKLDYQEAVIMLAETYVTNQKSDKAINLLQDWIKKNPSDSEAINLLKTLLTS